MSRCTATTSQPLASRARTAGLAPSTVWMRLHRGWTLQDALTSPPSRSFAPVIEEYPELLDDVLAGESSARVIAERYGVSARTVVRVRARLRAQGRRVRVPEAA